MDKRILQGALAFFALALPLWPAPGAAEKPNTCPKAELEAMIRGTEIGSIDYTENYQNEAALDELKISTDQSQLQFAELSTRESFGADLPEKTRELISRFINSGNPRFTIIYHCPTGRIADIKMYADYWGSRAIPISAGTELPVSALYTMGKQYRGRKLSAKAIQTIGSEFRQTLLRVFQENRIRPVEKKNSR